MPLGFTWTGLAVLVVLSFLICVTVNSLAMEAAVLFTPAFLYVFPVLVPGFPDDLGINGAIGLALFVEFFGYSSSVSGYWFREQIDFTVARQFLMVSVPFAVVARIGGFLAPPDLLKFLFGGLLLALAFVLFEAHHLGREVVFRARDLVPGGLADGAVAHDYESRTRFRDTATDGGFGLTRLDRGVVAAGGTMAGLVGIGIGELSNTLLTVRKRIPVDVATGTSALVLHLTVLSALVTNLVWLQFAPASFHVEEYAIPFGIGLILAPVVVVGGQTGAFINSRLTERTTLRVLMAAYTLVGLFVMGRILLL